MKMEEINNEEKEQLIIDYKQLLKKERKNLLKLEEKINKSKYYISSYKNHVNYLNSLILDDKSLK